MSGYRKVWDCCGEETYTKGWEPKECPFCEKERILKEVRKCLVLWRCVSCGHDLIEMPKDPFGNCPQCGVASMAHSVFSDDRDGLIDIVEGV